MQETSPEEVEESSAKMLHLQRDEGRRRLKGQKTYAKSTKAHKNSFQRKYSDSKRIKQTDIKHDGRKMDIQRRGIEESLYQNIFKQQQEMIKDETNASNFKKQEDNKQKCTAEDINRKSYHSTKCCRRRVDCRERSLERRPFPNKNQATKMLRRHISRVASMYTQLITEFPNLKVLLLLCQDILLLKMLNKIRGTASYTNIKKKIERSYLKMNPIGKKQQKIKEVKSVESIAENSLKRLFEEHQQENQTSRKRFKTQPCLPDYSESEKSVLLHPLTQCSKNLEQESLISQLNDDDFQQSSKHTCKCYKNHARGEVPSKKVRRMLENYEKMITTCDAKTDIEDVKDKENGLVSNKSHRKEEEKSLSCCFNDSYECECKSKDSDSFQTYKLKKIFKQNCKNNGKFGVTLQTTSQCTVIKGQCNSNNYSTTKIVNNILDQMVSEALHDIRKSYQRDMEVSDSNDEQNNADDERSSDSESECKKISAHTTTICKKSAKTENLNYVLLFGRSKSQLKKKELSGLNAKENSTLTKKIMTSKQEPGQTHIERNIHHYRMLQ